MELKSPTSSLFLHAGKDLCLSTNQMPYPVSLLLTGNTLDLEKRIGGLLTTDLAEAQRLLERLQKGG
jgi:hypothetical protein